MGLGSPRSSRVVPASGATMPALIADEREAVQKKTFTKWVNSHLARVTCRISDLYMDLRDGRVLIKLLEVLSGELLVGLPSSWRPWDPCHAMPCHAPPAPGAPLRLLTLALTKAPSALGGSRGAEGVPGQGWGCALGRGGC